jgi:lysozyme family protein
VAPNLTPASFPRAFAVIVGEEGGYSATPWDPGNWTGGAIRQGQLRGTKYGISAAAFPLLDIQGLTLADARAIYLMRVWRPLALDDLPSDVALLVFDAAVHSGNSTSVRWLQRAVGAATDGLIGPATIAATLSCIQRRGVAGLQADLLTARMIFLAGLPTWPAFRAGWIARLFRLAFNANPEGQS